MHSCQFSLFYEGFITESGKLEVVTHNEICVSHARNDLYALTQIASTGHLNWRSVILLSLFTRQFVKRLILIPNG